MYLTRAMLYSSECWLRNSWTGADKRDVIAEIIIHCWTDAADQGPAGQTGKGPPSISKPAIQHEQNRRVRLSSTKHTQRRKMDDLGMQVPVVFKKYSTTELTAVGSSLSSNSTEPANLSQSASFMILSVCKVSSSWTAAMLVWTV
jgi:hypothetical protein